MNFNYTDRITEAPKFDASNMPRRDEWTDELAFSAVVWLNDCRVWMYRGAWAEWPVEDIEMCVPMSTRRRWKAPLILATTLVCSGSAPKTATSLRRASTMPWGWHHTKPWKHSKNIISKAT